MHFGTARAVKNAALEDLEQAPGHLARRWRARSTTISTRAADAVLDTDAIVVALRPHGEHGAVVRLMTPEHGLQAAYVRGARGRRLRPVLVPGNLVEATLSARTETQLAAGDGRAGPQPRAACWPSRCRPRRSTGRAR